MSARLYRITYIDGDLGDEGLPVQDWFPTHAKAMAGIRMRQDIDPEFSAVIEEFNVPTGGRQLATWLNDQCCMARRVTPGPQAKAA